MKNLDFYLQEAIQNITEDREVTKALLKDVMELLASSNMQHEKVGVIAAKYVETLQRSNEQLVKITALIQKRETKDVALSDDDKKELYDLIQGEKE
jgi:hypothetical protein|tara:strand:- start:900 stop:1187 length:288 start_codon:yes stop_codon:yes gene_type:complete